MYEYLCLLYIHVSIMSALHGIYYDIAGGPSNNI